MSSLDVAVRPSQFHGIARSSQKGDELLLNDRSRPLKMMYSLQISPPGSQSFDVLVLKGNQTQYHLLCWDNASHGPMLYKESEYDEQDGSYDYHGSGQRVYSLGFVDGPSFRIESDHRSFGTGTVQETLDTVYDLVKRGRYREALNTLEPHVSRQEIEIEEALSDQEKEQIDNGNFIEVIKSYRSRTGAQLTEAKNIADDYRDQKDKSP